MSAPARPGGERALSAPARPGGERALRIGEVAELTGTTPRTIRYYEEIGLLAGSVERQVGKHRLYTEVDVQRIEELMRMRDLLGLSLDELSQLMEAESARAELRREYEHAEDPAQQRRILTEALGHIETQLALVRQRRQELKGLDTKLTDKRQRALRRLEELSGEPQDALRGATSGARRETRVPPTGGGGHTAAKAPTGAV